MGVRRLNSNAAVPQMPDCLGPFSQMIWNIRTLKYYHIFATFEGYSLGLVGLDTSKKWLPEMAMISNGLDVGPPHLSCR